METFYSILCGLALSPWFSACAQGDWKAVQDLLHRCPIFLKSRGPLGYTALHYAAEQGHTHACQFLLQEGADLLVPDVLGEYPPSKAIQKGAEDTAAFLDSYAQQQGAGKGLDWGWVCWLSENVWKSCLWFESCQSGDWATVKRLFERGADIEAQGPWENTALHYAAEQGNIEACCFLLQNGGDLPGENFCGETPMHLAAKNGHEEMLRLLIARNAAKLPEGLLHSAVEGGYRDIVEFLLEAGLPVDSTDDRGIGNTPLGVAVSYGYQDIAALCLQWGANIHAPHNGYPLVYEAIKNPPLLKFLQQKGADVLRLNQYGKSLLYAVARGLNCGDDVEVFEQLLGMGLNPHIRDHRDRSLLHSAVIHHKPLEFVKYLVESVGILADLRDDEGLTALEGLRLHRYSPDTAEYLESLEA